MSKVVKIITPRYASIDGVKSKEPQYITRYIRVSAIGQIYEINPGSDWYVELGQDGFFMPFASEGVAELIAAFVALGTTDE